MLPKVPCTINIASSLAKLVIFDSNTPFPCCQQFLAQYWDGPLLWKEVLWTFSESSSCLPRQQGSWRVELWENIFQKPLTQVAARRIVSALAKLVCFGSNLPCPCCQQLLAQGTEWNLLTSFVALPSSLSVLPPHTKVYICWTDVMICYYTH